MQNERDKRRSDKHVKRDVQTFRYGCSIFDYRT